MKSRFSLLSQIVILILLIGTVSGFAQLNVPNLRVSPQARVYQAVGFANVEINYSRPSVRGRPVWGQLVPYGLAANPFGNGKPMPWRAGANENTTMTLSHEATINGNAVPAGTYGIHIEVQEEEWNVILSKDFNAWGSFFYDESNDAVRFKIKPQSNDHQEWLSYSFDNLTTRSCDVNLAWEKLIATFSIEFDQHTIVLDTYRVQLTALQGFNQAAWARAANYCLQNNVNLEEAMTWIEKALAMNGGNNFNNNFIKAGLVRNQGDNQEADRLQKAAIALATEAELNAYGYQLMAQNQLDEAIDIFKLNIKRFPKAWNVYDSLGEALANKGDTKGAKKQYEKALKLAPEAQKARIQNILNNL